MDTGFGNLLDPAAKLKRLERTRSVLGVAVCRRRRFVGDRPGDRFDRDAYALQIEPIVAHGGTPVVIQSYGLTGQDDPAVVASYAEVGRHCDRFIGFELGTMFAPFGKIYSLEVYAGLLGVKQCIGADIPR